MMGFIRECRHQRQLSLLSYQCESSKRDFRLYRSLGHLINSNSISKHRNLSTTAKAKEDKTARRLARLGERKLSRGPFLESPETFRTYFRLHNSLRVFKMKASRGTKLCIYFNFFPFTTYEKTGFT